MINHKPTDTEQQSLREFGEFIQAETVKPTAETDHRVLSAIGADLCLTQWPVFAKVAVIETAAGIATLFVCPQFGLGFSGHNALLHSLHEAVEPLIFYAICGLLFISLGAVMSALVLRRNEIQVIKRSKYAYYFIYAFAACLVLTQVGTGALLLSASAWILGAVIGNSLGFGLVSRLRLPLYE